MRRRNPGPSSLPNAPIDLTPLLDVIFIFLFVVMIGYALAAEKAGAAAAEEVAAARAETARAEEALRLAEEELAKDRQEIVEKEALAAAYEDRIRDYEGQVIGEVVKIVTISGSYDREDSKKREVTVMLNGSAPVIFSITPDTMDGSFSRIRRMLEDYIGMFAESDRTVIVFSVNSRNIQHRDKLRLDAMIDEFTEAYSFVY